MTVLAWSGMVVTRRSFLCGTAAAAAGLALPAQASASMALAVSLGELVHTCQHAAVGISVDAFSRWEMVAKKNRIVTYSVVDIERPLDGRPLAKGPIMVRTLGGIVGGVGQVVHGEAVIALGERTALFLRGVTPDFYSVLAMAQGAYPVKADTSGVPRLHAALEALELRRTKDAAVHRLNGRSLQDAESMVADELTRGSR
jgi:hypothetical protein